MHLFLISNMYPSKKDNLYGVFVKNMHEECEKQGVIFPYKALIKGRSTWSIGKIIQYLKHYCRIIFYSFKSGYDVFYLHYFSHHVPVMWLLYPFKRKPWVVNVHGTDLIDLMKHPRVDYFAKVVLKKVDLLVVPSSYYKALVIRNYPFLNTDKIFISPSGGLDLSYFNPRPKKKKSTEIMLGFVSRFEEAKGWKIFLKALAILKQENIPFQGLIIGKGPDQEKIKLGIKVLGLEENITFVGFVSQNRLSDYYNQMELYIFPSYRESLGLTGLEAMACGRPAIGSAINGLKTYIKPGKNGFLFEPGNPNDLVSKIKAYIALNEADQVTLQKNARKTAEEYGRTEVTKKLIARLSSLTIKS